MGHILHCSVECLDAGEGFWLLAWLSGPRGTVLAPDISSVWGRLSQTPQTAPRHSQTPGSNADVLLLDEAAGLHGALDVGVVEDGLVLSKG